MIVFSRHLLQSQPDDVALPGADLRTVIRRTLGAPASWVYGRRIAPHNRFVKGVLYKRLLVRHPIKPLRIRLVLGEKKVARFFTEQAVISKRVMTRLNHRNFRRKRLAFSQIRTPIVVSPAPGVAKPERR